MITRPQLISGQKFGFWTVLNPIDKVGWLCRCECGLEKRVSKYSLLDGTSSKCLGCDAKIKASKRRSEDLSKKLCPKCDTFKDLEDFYKAKNGIEGLHGWCKLCKDLSQKFHRQSNLEIYAKQNRGAVRKLRIKVIEKLGSVCVHCGENDFRCIQIDHVNGGGSKELKNISSPYSYYKGILEMQDAHLKYQLLCANCNWRKRWDEKEGGYGGEIV